MPHEPKKRHSRARQGKRRAAIKLTLEQVTICPNCAASHTSHTVCPNCGFYKGKQVLAVKKPADLKTE